MHSLPLSPGKSGAAGAAFSRGLAIGGLKNADRFDYSN
ncbi:hypothetical protein DCCM_4698 [Desulfocucumis palustris]|uniref:Uncharacterized protein n=1 Tax=Desulfocucumis palustris TaxID=1898651 RepID=A0A2L2XGR5_9FIRM|nr:hypothetical protein DCCM_4698 [Desulfocucumis palustris]